MIRQFNGKPLELLAPAGTFDIYKDIIDSECDAVYCGGQILNMRMIRKGYNLSNDELKHAVELANERGKKVYITLNSLLEEAELNQAEEYLEYLDEIQPHALIIQDTAVLDLVRKKGLNLSLHSSVMMNIHNLDMIRFLEMNGVSRVVLSREMSLEEISSLNQKTEMELEYFTHGDMCVAHGSQCLYSSYLFGMSSNRGRCLKPCRWAYSQSGKVSGKSSEKAYPLAVKDLSMYSHLGDMILSGITSFKIEGRMRQKEFIVPLVNRYGEALNRFLEDPLAAYSADPHDMEEFRKRDFSSAYAYGRPGLKNINTRGEGSGEFYSSGKMFSTPTKEREIGSFNSSDNEKLNIPAPLKMSVRVNSMEQAQMALDFSADRIIISAEPFAPDQTLTLNQMSQLSRNAEEAGCETVLALPRMMNELQSTLLRSYLANKPEVHALLIGHCGLMDLCEDWILYGDSTLNLYNSRSVLFYENHGLQGWTPSLELPLDSLLNLPERANLLGCKSPGEVILHGFPTMMYLDHDISDEKEDILSLDTSESSLTVRRDFWNRYHLLSHKEFTLLPLLPRLIQAGYQSFRLELQHYNSDQAGNVLDTVRLALNTPDKAVDLFENLISSGGGFSHGAHSF